MVYLGFAIGFGAAAPNPLMLKGELRAASAKPFYVRLGHSGNFYKGRSVVTFYWVKLSS
jgi:hypothetical protein